MIFIFLNFKFIVKKKGTPLMFKIRNFLRHPLKPFFSKKVRLKIKLIKLILRKSYNLSSRCEFTYIDKDEFTDENIKILCKGLDDESIRKVKFISSLLETIFVIKSMKYKSIIRNETFFSEEDLYEQKRCASLLKKAQKKYFLAEYSPEAVIYAHGLAFANNSVIDYIKAKDFIDAGAYIGDSNLVMQNYSPRKIYSLDPSPNVRERFLKTMEKNKIPPDKYEFIEQGLGDKEELVSFDDTKNAGASIDKNGDKIISIIKLDDFVGKNNLSVGFIKTDLEGYGLKALHGMTETIKKHRPVLSLALYHNADEFFMQKKYLDELNLNYIFRIINTNPFIAIAETCLLAIPQEIAKQ